MSLGCNPLSETLSISLDADAVLRINVNLALELLLDCQLKRIELLKWFGICGFYGLELMSCQYYQNSMRKHRMQIGEQAVAMLL